MSTYYAPDTELNPCHYSISHNNPVKEVLFIYTDETPAAKKEDLTYWRSCGSHTHICLTPKPLTLFSVVKPSLLAAMVSFLEALKRNAKKSKQVLGSIWEPGF